MKLIVKRGEDSILGAHLIGPDAGEMIQLLGVAITMGARKADLDAILAVHPTGAEEWVTMRTPTASTGAARPRERQRIVIEVGHEDYCIL